jgi:hypothetical protein
LERNVRPGVAISFRSRCGSWQGRTNLETREVDIGEVAAPNFKINPASEIGAGGVGRGPSEGRGRRGKKLKPNGILWRRGEDPLVTMRIDL